MELLKDKLKVAVCQMTSVDDWQRNKEQIWELLNSIKNPEYLDIICFPENSLYMRLNLESTESVFFDLSHDFFKELKSFATKNKVLLHLGALPLCQGNKKVNASVLVFPDGRVDSVYNKIHLFDISLEGQKPVFESDIYSPGEEPAIVEHYGWKFGMSICYDVRFSELFKYYRDQKVDMIFVPSSFLVTTGKAHWHTLLRARAIETQCYIIAAAQGGDHDGKRKTYGHSIAFSPWGTTLGEIGDGSSQKIFYFEASKSDIQRVRVQIPMHDHARL